MPFVLSAMSQNWSKENTNIFLLKVLYTGHTRTHPMRGSSSKNCALSVVQEWNLIVFYVLAGMVATRLDERAGRKGGKAQMVKA